MRNHIVTILTLLLLVSSSSYSQGVEAKKELLIRCDDIGMCHSVNMAVSELIKTGIPFSTSVMFACPWYKEAVKILKGHPQVTIGAHLVLTSEWDNYKWGPVAGRTAVPSLVDSNGYFFPSVAAFNNNNPSLKDIEIELRAQIDRALASGLAIRYLDFHMGTAVSKPEYVPIVVKLAKEYHLGISGFFGEEFMKNMFSVPVNLKSDSLYKRLTDLTADHVNLLVCHIGLDNSELQAMFNSFGLQEMSKNRNAELEALLSPMFMETVKKNNIELLTYSNLIDQVGLENMKVPEVIKY